MNYPISSRHFREILSKRYMFNINFNFKRLAQIASPLLGLFIFGFSVWAIANELRQYHYLEIVRSLQAIPKNYLLLALVLTILNYFMLTTSF